jgi:hypothetical protein
MMRTIAIFWMAGAIAAFAVPPTPPYAPAAGESGSTAIHKDDARFVAWANGNLAPEYGTDVDTIWKTPAKALGTASTDPYHIVCLGNGGRVTMVFPHPIMDGVGADFAVFENAISNTFLELAFVEVSSNGRNFFRFDAFSETTDLVGPFASVDPIDIHGFAGKYRLGYGTPFDLAELPDSPLLDKRRVRFVRIVDIVGSGVTKDSKNRPIYDPYLTVGSGGFDLDAVGVIHQNDGEFQVVQSDVVAGEFHLAWESNPGSRYRIERSLTLKEGEWEEVGEVLAGNMVSATTGKALPIPGESKCFWRVLRLAD